MESEVPDTFLISCDDDLARHIGRTSDGGQFFLTTPFVPAHRGDPGREFIALYRFSPTGELVNAEIRDMGPRSELDMDYARGIYNEVLSSLGEVEFGDIEIAPFKVERFGVDFGLISRELEDDDEPAIEAQPGNYMAFFEPWDGTYDT